MNVYLRKLFDHDLTHEVSVTQDIVQRFFEGHYQLTFYKKSDTEKQNPYTVLINDATDARFGGQFKSLYSNASEGDILVIIKLKNNSYSLELIKKSSPAYALISTFFVGASDRHSVIYGTEEIGNHTPNNQPLQQIFYGAPGTGKSHEIKKTTDLQPKENVFRTTFHPDSDYSTFVGCYKPTMQPTSKEEKTLTGKDEEITYKFVPQAFLKAYIRAYQTEEPVYLVIEEINRGNCAQIFGDLFQLLDREDGVSEYPIKADDDLAKYLRDTYGEDFAGIANGELCLPSNLYIWATMNTSDQSLFPIDSAFKRRWEWQYMPIEDAGKNWKIRVNNNEYDWYAFLTAINHEILALTHSEDKQLGYFFAKADAQGVIDAAKLVNKVYFYLWTDVFKDYETENNSVFKKADSNDTIAYKDFFVSGQKINEEVAEQLLKNLKLNTPEAE